MKNKIIIKEDKKIVEKGEGKAPNEVIKEERESEKEWKQMVREKVNTQTRKVKIRNGGEETTEWSF